MIVITVKVLPKCILNYNNWLADPLVFCFVDNSKILIEFTAKNAASAPEQQAEPIKIIKISVTRMRMFGSINLGQNKYL